MADSEEAGPLLASYDATSPASGRGKRRFQMRQQMRKSGRQTSIYKSVFSPAQPRSARNRNSRTVGSPAPTKGEGAASRRPNSLSTVQEHPDADDAHRGSGPPSKHSKLYDTLNPKSHSPSAVVFQNLITWVIVVDAVVYILSTEPDLAHLSNIFYWAEGVTSTIFAIEYVCRLAVCTEKKSYAKHGPIRGRWRYMRTSQALIDALATFPFFLELVTGLPLPTMTYLRVFRVLRLTRTRAYSRAMDAVARVLYFNREILLVAAMLGLYLVVVTSVLMYYLRPRGRDVDLVDDPDDFNSIGSTMVLSILMLTGQGGPSGNLPWYTQCVVLLTGIFSVAMFAIPASMLTWGFEAEAERLGARAKRRALARRRGEVYASSGTSSSSSASSHMSGFGDISTSDEEYMNIIGGDDGGGGGGKVGEGGEGNVVGMHRQLSSGQDKMMSMLGRVEELEDSMARANAKLDLVLQKLEGTRVDR